MIATASLLLASLFPQGTTQDPPRRVPPRTGRITLPPVRTGQPDRSPPVRVRDDAESFYRDVIDLRRSKALTPTAEQQLLAGLQANYSDPATMAVNLAATGKTDLVHGLMKVVDLYGRSIHAEKLHFLLLTRPMGRVTARVVKTVVGKAGSKTKGYLFDYLGSKYSPLRAAAATEIVDFITAEDVPQLLRLSREQRTDIRRRALQVLAQVDDDRARKRILELLTVDSVLAPEACKAACAQGERMITDLAAIVGRPARGRAFGYAAFALARLERALGRPLLTPAMVPHLRKELTGDDPLLRSTSAIALGCLAYRAADWQGSPREDRLIVDGLLDLVAPEDFVTSLQLLQPVAREVLVRFSGHNVRAGPESWRGWWSDARAGFVGLRQSIPVDAKTATGVAIHWRAGDHSLWFRGPAVPADRLPKGATEYVLSADQMVRLIDELRGLGLMSERALPTVPEVWSVDLRVADMRCMQFLTPESGKAIHRAFAQTARDEIWQKYRDPATQPDSTAFWQAERRWLADHPGQQSERTIHHILARLPALDAAARDRALTDLQSVPGLPGRITAAHANRLIAVAKDLQEFQDGDFRLLEIALLAKDDTTWRRAIGVLEGRIAGAGNQLASRLFALLGPERVVTTIRHKSPGIAVAAMHDAAASRNVTAVPVLIDRLRDPHPDVQRTAIYALGVLHATQAREQLIRLETDAPPAIRREIWGALGRIGGPQVPVILKRAMENPDLQDKLAALGAMGHTNSAELAQFLAARYVTEATTLDAFAQRAELALRQIGPLLAVPALRPHLQMQDGPARQRLILLLGEFQDPRVTRDLIDLLRSREHEVAAARYLAEITGVDLRGVNDQARRMYAWFAANRAKGQAQWFLDALRAAKIETTLELAQLTRGAGVEGVPELARILTTVEQPHLRVLTASMLRQATGEDFTRGVRHADAAALLAIADLYKVHAATIRAAGK